MNKLRIYKFIIIGTLLLEPLSFLDASSSVELYLLPRTGSFMEGSTFEVPILINTNETSVSGIEVKIKYDKNKLSIVKPSSSTSIIDVWTEVPSYDNTKGTLSYTGRIPEGITSKAGLITNITFRAVNPGRAVINIEADSKVTFKDSVSTEAQLDLGRVEYDIFPKISGGVNIFSDTHPSQGEWYNNSNPVFAWEKFDDSEEFSFEFDNKPSTIPDNISDSKETSKNYEEISSGLWYFHLKAKKKGVWGSTNHFLARIDITPPVYSFLEANHLVAAPILVGRTLLSYAATDNLSGIDRYEVGIIDKSKPVTASPVFIEAESPFQVPYNEGSNLRVIVRTFDKAGNSTDESIDIKQTPTITFSNRTFGELVVVGGALVAVIFGIFFWKRSRKNNHDIAT